MNTTLDEQVGVGARRAARGADVQALLTSSSRRRGRSCEMAGRGEVDRPLLEQLPRARRRTPRSCGPGSRGSSATAPARPRCASSAAPSSRTSSSSATLAELSGTEAALTYVSCWNANEAVIPTLTDATTVILTDELNHASIIDAVRLSRPAQKVIYPHSDMGALRDALAAAPARRAQAHRHRRRLLDGGRPREAARRSSSSRASTTRS